MLKYGALVAFLVSLLLSQGIMEIMYTSVNVTPIVGIQVTSDGCHYNGFKFNGLQYSWNPCQRLSCHLQSQVLVKMECGAPPEGCYLQEGIDRPFPRCCRVRCPEMSVCVTSNGSLMKSGETLNSSDPCLRYTCRNGILLTQGCPIPSETSCAVPYTNTGLPYPECCGLKRDCIG
ncbi:uncharacterized protein [Dermacentor andersoni]|uniref:uncharacterized protein isoform X2 n=1 Tax=Dermacentor andersoni TaxID=34620 RepID=UPI00241797C5|nr:uncharacterized protein LOC126539186 isoform X2 [Dermacentor andersoni]